MREGDQGEKGELSRREEEGERGERRARRRSGEREWEDLVLPPIHTLARAGGGEALLSSLFSSRHNFLRRKREIHEGIGF